MLQYHTVQIILTYRYWVWDLKNCENTFHYFKNIALFEWASLFFNFIKWNFFTLWLRVFILVLLCAFPLSFVSVEFDCSIQWMKFEKKIRVFSLILRNIHHEFPFISKFSCRIFLTMFYVSHIGKSNSKLKTVREYIDGRNNQNATAHSGINFSDSTISRNASHISNPCSNGNATVKSLIE